MNSYSKKYKIILLGDSGVGKTSIINQYINGKFDEGTPATVGVEFQKQILTINGEQIKLCIWDTSGQEKFRTISQHYYRNIDGVILVYDITKPQTLTNINDYWIHQLQENAVDSYENILIGNKSDLKEKSNPNNLVSTEMGKQYAQQFQSIFIEASAKTGDCLKSAIDEFIFRIHTSNKILEHEDKVDLRDKKIEEIDQGMACC